MHFFVKKGKATKYYLVFLAKCFIMNIVKSTIQLILYISHYLKKINGKFKYVSAPIQEFEVFSRMNIVINNISKSLTIPSNTGCITWSILQAHFQHQH
jgi:hypothetical protein